MNAATAYAGPYPIVSHRTCADWGPVRSEDLLGRAPVRSVTAHISRPCIARCPGCGNDTGHPIARTCEQVGCPIKHLAGASHKFAGAA